MQMSAMELIEMILVLVCLATSVFCFARLFIHTLRTHSLTNRFKARLALVDPKASKEIFLKWHIADIGLNDAYSIEQYMQDKRRGLDPELLSLGTRITAPFKYGMLTLLMIPGGFVAAVLVLVLFKAVFHLE